ncbi:hypothetical protein MESS2_790012 [Mesorhizobium metallidurans STM 2683]|uniref:Uncharacterized protein n=1 Tax=Mesorhizobium metallidurans STM 2683 TaxID=1297569 RepID=M5EXJ9_9HYPH|nr:hypothetical protein MESS2_790012 [Mesorhizobium metallidurans STM 2683]
MRPSADGAYSDYVNVAVRFRAGGSGRLESQLKLALQAHRACLLLRRPRSVGPTNRPAMPRTRR